MTYKSLGAPLPTGQGPMTRGGAESCRWVRVLGPAEEPGADAVAGSQSSEGATPPLTRESRGPQVQSSH
jgi:hypothetical protein